MNFANRTEAVAFASIANMVIVGAHDDDFIRQLWIVARLQQEYVSTIITERLKVIVARAGRRQVEGAQLFDKILPGRVPAAATGRPAFVHVVGQNFDVMVE